MSEKRSTREDDVTKTGEVIDSVRDNVLRIADEVVKVQPQLAQSISNLQLDYIQNLRSMIQSSFATQKQILSALGIPQMTQFSEPIARQSSEITNNVVRSIGIFNQLGVNALDATRENVKIYNRTADAFSDFNNNVLRTWTSYWSAQQQQFYRA